ncbi:MAG: glutamate 5-kinase [Candidatus Caenarcaniphilales bacterium]|nr:glutamate 5-kinase [Candidatus Caenarcaniphilales bacterium]
MKIIVLKIGTTSITKGTNKGINYSVINQLACETDILRQAGYKVLIVSSGAMGLGINRIGRENLESKLNSQDTSVVRSYKQAITSVGQVELMKTYENIFKYYDVNVGQVLIAHKGLHDKDRDATIKNTLEKMFEIDIIPIVNANDTVSSAELEYGDNDSLAARLATLLGAKSLIILSDVKGLYDKDPHKYPDAQLIKTVNKIDEKILDLAGESSSGSGMGGMYSKILAAQMCMNAGVKVEILCADHIKKISEIVKDPAYDLERTSFSN